MAPGTAKEVNISGCLAFDAGGLNVSFKTIDKVSMLEVVADLGTADKTARCNVKRAVKKTN